MIKQFSRTYSALWIRRWLTQGLPASSLASASYNARTPWAKFSRACSADKRLDQRGPILDAACCATTAGLCFSKNFRIIIFNRWGKKMYESTDFYHFENYGWDGLTDGGTEASDGVYYWIMDNRDGELHGYVELIRQ